MSGIPNLDVDAARIAALAARSSVVRRDTSTPIGYTLGNSDVLLLKELELGAFTGPFGRGDWWRLTAGGFFGFIEP